MKRRSGGSKSNTVSVDFTGVNSANRLEDGEYLGVIKEVVQEKSSGSGNDMLTFTLEVEGGEYKYWCPLMENSLWKLRDLLECAGFEVPESKMDLDLAELIGVEIGVIVENEAYQGKKRPKVVGTIPADEAGGEEAGEEEKEPAKPARRGAKAEPPPREPEKPAATSGRRRRAEPEPEPEEEAEEGFNAGDKVSFVDEGKTLKGSIVKESDEGGIWVVKVGKDEWEIPADELTAL